MNSQDNNDSSNEELSDGSIRIQNNSFFDEEVELEPKFYTTENLVSCFMVAYIIFDAASWTYLYYAYDFKETLPMCNTILNRDLQYAIYFTTLFFVALSCFLFQWQIHCHLSIVPIIKIIHLMRAHSEYYAGDWNALHISVTIVLIIDCVSGILISLSALFILCCCPVLNSIIGFLSLSRMMVRRPVNNNGRVIRRATQEESEGGQLERQQGNMLNRNPDDVRENYAASPATQSTVCSELENIDDL